MLPEIIHQSLLDVIDSIDAIESYLVRFMGERRDFNFYMAERFLRRCVERELKIVGEATKRIMREDPDFQIG